MNKRIPINWKYKFELADFSENGDAHQALKKVGEYICGSEKRMVRFGTLEKLIII